MSLGTMRGYALGGLAALALMLASGASVSAQHNQPPYCPPCGHPYFGYYPTCWAVWPAGWNSWNCGRGPQQDPTQAGPRRPPTRNGEEPELIPPPRPDPNGTSMGRLGRYTTRLWR
jgi:hypothetical protein